MTVTRVVRDLAEHADRVAYRRESFTVLHGQRPIAELRPLPAGARLAELPELIAAAPRLSAAAPRLSAAERDAFSADLAAAREELGSRAARRTPS